jgi:hypothetical protein
MTKNFIQLLKFYTSYTSDIITSKVFQTDQQIYRYLFRTKINFRAQIIGCQIPTGTCLNCGTQNQTLADQSLRPMITTVRRPSYTCSPPNDRYLNYWPKYGIILITSVAKQRIWAGLLVAEWVTCKSRAEALCHSKGGLKVYQIVH